MFCDFALVDDLIDDSEMEVALLELEGEAFTRNHRGKRSFVRRNFVEEHQKLMEDYFVLNPRYDDTKFVRRFRMSKEMFLKIVDDLQNDEFFKQKVDALGKLGLSTIQKCTAAVRLLAYGISADAVDEYIKIGESTALFYLKKFCSAVTNLYGEHFLRYPNQEDITRLLNENANRGFPGMLGSIDCMHWQWANCPTAYKGQYTGKEGKATLVLEAVASYDTHIWHSFFGCPGSLNDLNILDRSPLVNHVINDDILKCNYELNGKQKEKAYFLADGIYPDWEIFVKTISHPNTPKEKLFSRKQESARKDVERAFGILKKSWHVLNYPARFQDLETLQLIMNACIILHNMRIEYNTDTGPIENDPLNVVETGPTNFADYLQKRIEVRNSLNHSILKRDLIDHIWNHFGDQPN